MSSSFRWLVLISSFYFGYGVISNVVMFFMQGLNDVPVISVNGFILRVNFGFRGKKRRKESMYQLGVKLFFFCCSAWWFSWLHSRRFDLAGRVSTCFLVVGGMLTFVGKFTCDQSNCTASVMPIDCQTPPVRAFIPTLPATVSRRAAGNEGFRRC